MKPKPTFIIAVIILLYCTQSLQAQTAPFRMVGTYQPNEPGRAYLCRNTEVEIIPAQTREEFDSIERHFLKRHANEEPLTFMLGPFEASIVYSYENKDAVNNCTYKLVSFAPGSTIEEAQKNLANIQFESSKGFSQPKLEFTWNPAANASTKKILEVSYGKLNAQYISGATGASAQFKNQHPDSAAVVVLRPEGQPAKVMVLQPGESRTVTIEKDGSYEIEVSFRKKGEVKDPVNWVDDVKKALRDWIIINQGKVEPYKGEKLPTPTWGGRG